MIMHLCQDGNFIANSMYVFEHFYPNQNTYIILRWKGSETNYIKNVSVKCYKLGDLSYLDYAKDLFVKEKIDHLVIHGYTTYYLPIMQMAKMQNSPVKCYWLFWGYELYSALAEMGKYKLLDNISVFSKLTYLTPSPVNCFLRKLIGRKTRISILKSAIPYIDYFCFWLQSDYDLLVRSFETKIKFKYFQYGSLYRGQETSVDLTPFPKQDKRIMVNHQASLNGNFKTLFKKIHNLGLDDDYKVFVPLSYGSTNVRPEVMKMGKKYLSDKFVPMMDMMSLYEYNNFLSTIQVAIFGQLRQEATGNIYALLCRGAKVFLREANPLLAHYRSKGYILYSFEKDLNSIADLSPLTDEQQLHNMKTAEEVRVFYEDFMPSLFND